MQMIVCYAWRLYSWLWLIKTFHEHKIYAHFELFIFHCVYLGYQREQLLHQGTI